MKLGEFFVKKGLINPGQLEEALRCQLIFGGHLGTCLLELGFIDESTLGRTLAEMFGVDYAPPHFLNNIPKAIIDLIPRRLAEKHHAVPFERKDKVLHVVMIDPKNLPSLDELAFATGHKIRPWVTPEARIFQVLERYYDLPRRQRYITVCQDMDGPDAAAKGRGGTMPARDAFGSAYAPPPYLAGLDQPAETPRHQDEDGSGIPSATPPAPRAETGTQEDVTRDFCAAESASDLAERALDHAARTLARCALFMVKGITATLWKWRADAGAAPATPLNLSVTADAPFDLLLGREYYLGPIKYTPRLRALYGPIGVEPPSEALLIPGYLEDRLVVILYGDGGKKPLQADVADLDLLVRKLACALQLVLIKRKIRSLEPGIPAAPADKAA